MLANLSTLRLSMGEGLLLPEPEDQAAWRLDAADGQLWLTSPAIPHGSNTGDERLSGLFACLSEHLLHARLPGLRLMAVPEGTVHLQLWLPQGLTPGSPAPQAQALWLECRMAWMAWQEALRTGEAPHHQGCGDTEGVADSRKRLLGHLVALAKADTEFSGRVQVLEDEMALCIQPEHETWSAVVRPDGQGQLVEVLLPVLQFPSDEQAALVAAQHALQLNAGPLLGPELVLALDAPDLQDALLLLRKTLPAGHAQVDDIKASIGQMLLVAAELRSRWTLQTADGPGIGPADALPVMHSPQDRFYADLRG